MEILNNLYQNLGSIMGVPVFTILFLLITNVFMVFAWYGHLKNKKTPLMFAILMSWLIALPEYAFHVPTNRLSFQALSLAELKMLQEFLALLIFMWFSHKFLQEDIHPRQFAGVIVVLAGVVMIFGGF